MPAMVLGLVLFACAAPPTPVVPDTPYPDRPDPAEAAQFTEQLAYDIAESLVTEVGPRFAGTAGDRKAVEWALLKLQVLGFEKVRAEPVSVPRWQRGTIAVEIRAPRAQALEAIALGGSVPTPAPGLEAQVLRVESVAALQRLPDRAVRGRIVYFAGRMERTRDKSGYRNQAPTRRQGPVVAARKGAVATLLRSIGTDTDGPPHTGRVVYEVDAPQIPAAALAAKSADALDAALKVGPVRAVIAIGSTAGGTAQSANVIGEIPGASDEIVLLGAHLDSWDNTPGASDDAAGVGIVIAAAHRIASFGKPRRTIRVVLFANEEFGHTGAKAYAQAHADELPRHTMVMEADSGSGAPFGLSAWVAGADWADVTRLAATLALESGQNGEEGGVDAAVLRKLGVPEVIVEQDASRYFDVHHTANDTLDRIDRAGLARATDVFAAVAQAASERDKAFSRLPAAPGTK